MSVDLLTGAVACVGMMLHSIVYMTSKRSHPIFRVLAGLAVFGWFANAALLLERLA